MRARVKIRSLVIAQALDERFEKVGKEKKGGETEMPKRQRKLTLELLLVVQAIFIISIKICRIYLDGIRRS